jgi:hypothetical protein
MRQSDLFKCVVPVKNDQLCADLSNFKSYSKLLKNRDRSFVRITFFRNSFFPSNFVLSKIWFGQVRLGGLGNVRG